VPVTIDDILDALCELDGGPLIRPAANHTVFGRRQGLWPPSRRDDIDDVRFPRHVLNRFEGRWATRFAQALRQPPSASHDDPLRSPQVRLLLGGSLKPPRRDRTFELPHVK
jgi:hypothetical protein